MRSWMLRAVFVLQAMVTTAALAVADDDQQSLAQRARFLWDARVQGNWATEYRFLAPADRGSTTTLEKFVAYRRDKGPFRYLSAKVGEVATLNDIGWVEVKYEIRPAAFPELRARQMQVWDHWQKRDGEWYPMARAEREQVHALPPNKRSAAEETALGTRVEEFWKAQEGGERARAYGYLDPAYQASTPEKEFVDRKPAHTYLSHRLEWVEVVGDRGRAKVASTRTSQDASPAKAAPENATIIEHWVKVKGQWYRVPDPS